MIFRCLIILVSLQIFLATEDILKTFAAFMQWRIELLADPRARLQQECQAARTKRSFLLQTCDISTYIRVAGEWRQACDQQLAFAGKLLPPRYYQIRWQCASAAGHSLAHGETTIFR